MEKSNLLGYTVSQMEDLAVALSEKPFRGRQLFKWLYKIRQYDFEMMTDLSRDLRRRLSDGYVFRGLDAEETAVSHDGTRKFLFRLDDGHPIETVLILDEESGRRTACVSSQVGCALGCRFCATGAMGLHRSLGVGEIVGQLLHLRDEHGDDAFTNVVFMGMGEPLLNLDNVVDAVRIISDGAGLSHSARKTTISTCGIIPGIRKLADTRCKAWLAISLNAAIQEKREKIMPVAATYRLEDLADAVKHYTQVTRTRVTFEYALFEGFNDTMHDVKAFSRLVKGIPCKINLLAYNPISGAEWKAPSQEKIDWFAKQLYPRVPAVTVRRSRGADIDAACGQLAGGSARRR